MSCSCTNTYADECVSACSLRYPYHVPLRCHYIDLEVAHKYSKAAFRLWCHAHRYADDDEHSDDIDALKQALESASVYDDDNDPPLSVLIGWFCEPSW